ncbi:hypothetical protein [Sorangium cellulosum]|uniref:hypothetical protein n=1 Tax=Sorangium cellulosum TaxID=56 RepID=UPI0011DD02C6|nr:hypothetical protein [Sorangium cellulosum]
MAALGPALGLALGPALLPPLRFEEEAQLPGGGGFRDLVGVHRGLPEELQHPLAEHGEDRTLLGPSQRARQPLGQLERPLDDGARPGPMAVLHGPRREQRELGVAFVEQRLARVGVEVEHDRPELELGPEARAHARDALGPAGDGAARGDDDHVAQRAGLTEEQAGREGPPPPLGRIDAALQLDQDPAAPATLKHEIEPQLCGLHEAERGVGRLEAPRELHAGELGDERAEQPRLLTQGDDQDLVRCARHAP